MASCWRNTLSVTVAGAQAEGGEQGQMVEAWELSPQASPVGGAIGGVEAGNAGAWFTC